MTTTTNAQTAELEAVSVYGNTVLELSDYFNNLFDVPCATVTEKLQDGSTRTQRLPITHVMVSHRKVCYHMSDFDVAMCKHCTRAR